MPQVSQDFFAKLPISPIGWIAIHYAPQQFFSGPEQCFNTEPEQ